MSEFEKAAKIYAQIKIIVDDHDAQSKCGSPAKGVIMAWADIERLGWEEGDLVYPSKGITLSAGGQYGNIRVLCDGIHSPDKDVAEEVAEPYEVVADGQIERNKDLVLV